MGRKGERKSGKFVGGAAGVGCRGVQELAAWSGEENTEGSGMKGGVVVGLEGEPGALDRESWKKSGERGKNTGTTMGEKIEGALLSGKE